MARINGYRVQLGPEAHLKIDKGYGDGQDRSPILPLSQRVNLRLHHTENISSSLHFNAQNQSPS